MDFDRIRLATSVTNRILNTYDAIKERRALPQPDIVPSTPPLVPEPTMQGVDLEMRLDQPIVGEASGEPAGQAVLTGGIIDTPLEGLMTAEGEAE